MDANMLRTLVAIDDNKTVIQISEELGGDLFRLREALYGLWRMGLIVPTDRKTHGRCHELIEKIVSCRSDGNPTLAKTLKTKLYLEGIDPKRFSSGSADDPDILEKLVILANDMGIEVEENGYIRHRQLSRGKIRLVMDCIVTQRSGGNPVVARAFRTKLALKGMDPHRYSHDTEDDPVILRKVLALARKMGIEVDMKSDKDRKEFPSRGQIHRLIHAIIEKRARGNPAIEKAMRAQFILKGIHPDHFGPQTLDEATLLKKLNGLAKSFGISPENGQAERTGSVMGRVRYIMDKIIAQKSKANPGTAKQIREKFAAQGLTFEKYTNLTEDDPKLVKKLEALARNLDVLL